MALDLKKSKLDGRYLEDALSHRLIHLGENSPQLLVTSQLGCGQCEAQIMDLKCLPPTTRVFSLVQEAENENSSNQMRFLKKLKGHSAPPLKLTKTFKTEWSIGDATPEILYFDAEGNLVFRRIGRQACETLLAQGPDTSSEEKRPRTATPLD